MTSISILNIPTIFLCFATRIHFCRSQSRPPGISPPFRSPYFASAKSPGRLSCKKKFERPWHIKLFGRGGACKGRSGMGRHGSGRHGATRRPILGRGEERWGRRVVTCAGCLIEERSTNGILRRRQSKRRAPEGTAAFRRRPDPASQPVFLQFFHVPFFLFVLSFVRQANKTGPSPGKWKSVTTGVRKNGNPEGQAKGKSSRIPIQ